MTIQLDTITHCAIDMARGSYAEKCPDLLLLDSDEESSYYDSDSDSSSAEECTETERRVSFATKLVTQVKTRPRTSMIEKKQLFYTSDEYDR